jgi:hypothetical protein
MRCGFRVLWVLAKVAFSRFCKRIGTTRDFNENCAFFALAAQGKPRKNAANAKIALFLR